MNGGVSGGVSGGLNGGVSGGVRGRGGVRGGVSGSRYGCDSDSCRNRSSGDKQLKIMKEWVSFVQAWSDDTVTVKIC